MNLTLSSTFSINMVSTESPTTLTFTPLTLEEAQSLAKDVTQNRCSCRHETTAVMSEILCGIKPEGGLISFAGTDGILVMVPKFGANREAREITIKDLEELKYFLVTQS